MPVAERRHGPSSLRIRLNVAALSLVLDAQGSGIRMAVPAAHASFVSGTADGGLELSVRSGRPCRREAWRPVFALENAWQLWQDEGGRYVFVPGPFLPPARHVTVDAEFRSGEVVGQFDDGEFPPVPVYPLDGIEIMLFANWLARTGDVILHAAGVESGGRGYAFAGASGAGKSTLAAAFAGTAGTTILGEDNLVLRLLGDRFWVFGTPWHLDTARCAPLGFPLEKIYFLDRTSGEGIGPCAPVDGIARLLQTAFVPYYRPESLEKILGNLALLAAEVPFFTLGYPLGSDPMLLL